MKRIWSVRIIPYLVFTVVPSTIGSRSRCTPWRDTSAPCTSLRLAILSISSRNTMPLASTLAIALSFNSSSLTRRAASSSASARSASRTFSLRVRRRPLPRFWNIDWICCVSSSMPGWASTSSCADGAASSISTSFSSISPSRSFLRIFCRVPPSPSRSASRPVRSRAGGSSTSSSRSSAASSARARTLRISASRVCFTAISARSRMIESTSRPT